MHAHITNALMRVAERPPQVFVSGSGSWLHDQAGKRYLDFVQGWASNCLGHAPPELAQALGAQAQRLVNCSPAFFNEPAARLAQSIAAHSCFDQVFFCTGFLDEVARKGNYLRLRLEQLSAKYRLGEVRGQGLLLALELGADLGPLLVERALERGLLLNSPRPSVLRFMPALNVGDAEIDTMVERLDLNVSRLWRDSDRFGVL